MLALGIVALILAVGIVSVCILSIYTKCPKCRKRSFGKVTTPILDDDSGEKYRQLIETCKFCNAVSWRGSKHYLNQKAT